MIELFKTHCRLPDKSIGEVCKRITVDGVPAWLVCNGSGWWHCDDEWILNNEVII